MTISLNWRMCLRVLHKRWIKERLCTSRFPSHASLKKPLFLGQRNKNKQKADCQNKKFQYKKLKLIALVHALAEDQDICSVGISETTSSNVTYLLIKLCVLQLEIFTTAYTLCVSRTVFSKPLCRFTNTTVLERPLSHDDELLATSSWTKKIRSIK